MRGNFFYAGFRCISFQQNIKKFKYCPHLCRKTKIIWPRRSKFLPKHFFISRLISNLVYNLGCHFKWGYFSMIKVINLQN